MSLLYLTWFKVSPNTRQARWGEHQSEGPSRTRWVVGDLAGLLGVPPLAVSVLDSGGELRNDRVVNLSMTSSGLTTVTPAASSVAGSASSAGAPPVGAGRRSGGSTGSGDATPSVSPAVSPTPSGVLPASPTSPPAGRTLPGASTRDRILARILEEGQTTTAALAEHFDLTQAAVRRHLTALEAQGLVASRDRRAGPDRAPGRPSRVHELTDRGRRQLAQAYDALALELLDYLRQRHGEAAVADFAEHKFAALTSAWRDRCAVEPDLAPAEALLAVLRDAGYRADLAPVRSGAQLLQHHCPYVAVAERFPELCQAETRAFSQLLDSHVQRLATIAHGDGVCTTHIPGPVPKGALGAGRSAAGVRGQPATTARTDAAGTDKETA